MVKARRPYGEGDVEMVADPLDTAERDAVDVADAVADAVAEPVATADLVADAVAVAEPVVIDDAVDVPVCGMASGATDALGVMTKTPLFVATP